MWIYWKDEISKKVLCVAANICLSWELDTLERKPNSQDFKNGILRCILVNEKYRILIGVSLEFVLKGSVVN